jgi:hypothetical protein
MLRLPLSLALLRSTFAPHYNADLKEKSQELDEGVPRAPGLGRCRLELLESASPVAFAEHPQCVDVQADFHSIASEAGIPE